MPAIVLTTEFLALLVSVDLISGNNETFLVPPYFTITSTCQLKDFHAIVFFNEADTLELSSILIYSQSMAGL